MYEIHRIGVIRRSKCNGTLALLICLLGSAPTSALDGSTPIDESFLTKTASNGEVIELYIDKFSTKVQLSSKIINTPDDQDPARASATLVVYKVRTDALSWQWTLQGNLFYKGRENSSEPHFLGAILRGGESVQFSSKSRSTLGCAYRMCNYIEHISLRFSPAQIRDFGKVDKIQIQFQATNPEINSIVTISKSIFQALDEVSRYNE